jgi:lia operon protein LiaG
MDNTLNMVSKRNLRSDNMLGFKKKTEGFFWSKALHGNGIEVLNIDTSSTEIDIFTGSADDIQIELKGEISSKLKENVQVEAVINGNTLSVKVSVERNSSFSMGIDVIKLALSVEVPQKLYEKVNAETSSGGIAARDLEGKEVHFRAGSGEVEASGIRAHSEFKSKTNSGSIELKRIEAPSIYAKANSGTLILQNLVAEKIQAKAASGNIIAKKWRGDFLAETNSGEIDLHAPALTGNIDVEASSGDVMLYFDKKPESFKLDFTGNSGEARLDMNDLQYQERGDHRVLAEEGDGKYAITVKTSSGDLDFSSKGL